MKNALPASKHVILEDDELSEHTGNDLQSGKEIADMLCNMSHEKLLEVVQNCPASMYVAEVRAERFCCACAYSCFNNSKFQWVVRPDCGAGTRPERHAVFKFPFWAVMLVPGQQRLTVFLCPPPTSSLTGVVAGTGMAQSGASFVCSSGTGTGSFLSQSETFLLPVSCALTTDVDGGFELKGELQSGHSLLRFWPEESVQFHKLEMKGDLGDAGQRSRSSLRCWHENTEQFHGLFWTVKSFFATSMAREHCVVPRA